MFVLCMDENSPFSSVTYPSFRHTDESSVTCQRAPCPAADVDCLLNTTRTIKWLHLALPNLSRLQEPLSLVTMATKASAFVTSVGFVILSGNEDGQFEVHTESAETG